MSNKKSTKLFAAKKKEKNRANNHYNKKYKSVTTIIGQMISLAANLKRLELLLENERAQNCRKNSFRKKIKHNINPVCAEQNILRKELLALLPKETTPIEDGRTGVDYIYFGTKIDQKFSYGALGDNHIKIRVKNRRLINESNWTMIINKENAVELFETPKLEAFVRKNWGLVQKRLIERKLLHTEYAISLKELYELERVTPIKAEMNSEELLSALNEAAARSNHQDSEKTTDQEFEGYAHKNIHTPRANYHREELNNEHTQLAKWKT